MLWAATLSLIVWLLWRAVRIDRARTAAIDERAPAPPAALFGLDLRAESLPADLPGEAARLLGVDTAAVQADRVVAARKLAAATQAVVALKGARTVVAAPDGEISINPTGGPALGTGGTGDVLAGAIGALLAQGLSPLDAARLGVYAHGLAGDLAAERRGPIGVLAGDVAKALPQAFARLSAAAGQGGNQTRVPPATPPSGR